MTATLTREPTTQRHRTMTRRGAPPIAPHERRSVVDGWRRQPAVRGRDEPRCGGNGLPFWRGLAVALAASLALWAAIIWAVARLLG